MGQQKVAVFLRYNLNRPRHMCALKFELFPTVIRSTLPDQCFQLGE